MGFEFKNYQDIFFFKNVCFVRGDLGFQVYCFGEGDVFKRWRYDCFYK